MAEFGFKLLKERHIDFDSNKRVVADYILSNEPSFGVCIECGCCAATCTTGSFVKFSLREINILLKRGENKRVKEIIDRCMLCGKCILVCPRGVNTRNVVSLARQAFKIYEADAI